MEAISGDASADVEFDAKYRFLMEHEEALGTFHSWLDDTNKMSYLHIGAKKIKLSTDRLPLVDLSAFLLKNICLRREDGHYFIRELKRG